MPPSSLAVGAGERLGAAKTPRPEVDVAGVALDAEEAAAGAQRGDTGGAGSRERVEDEVARGRARGEHALEQRDRLLGGVAPVDLLTRGGGRQRPDDLLVAGRGGFPDVPQ